MNSKMVLFVLVLSLLVRAENHFNKIDALKGNEIKGYCIYDKISKAHGLLVLFDGFPGGNDDPEKCARNLFKSTKLAQEAYKNKIATIIIINEIE